MVLVNGSSGIGTGWSSDIPNYNPRELVENIKALLNGQELSEIHPFYKGFTGTIERKGSGNYTVCGSFERVGPTTLKITELPIGKWTQDYKVRSKKKKFFF